MKNLIWTLVLTIVITQAVNAQKAKKEINYWHILENVTLKNIYNPFTEDFSSSPTFGKKVLKLDGKKINLSGFIIPADLTKGRMTLSKFSYSSCYFCGAAGPESVIEIEAKTPIIYRMDKAIRLQGTLRLNKKDEEGDYDPFRLLYILEDATYYAE